MFKKNLELVKHNLTVTKIPGWFEYCVCSLTGDHVYK